MDKALKAAPHRSVSVPIGNLHLTAWRVHGSDTMVTVGFVAEAPLKAEVRPAIDAEVKRGLARLTFGTRGPSRSALVRRW